MENNIKIVMFMNKYNSEAPLTESQRFEVHDKLVISLLIRDINKPLKQMK